MSIISTSGSWDIKIFNGSDAASLDELDLGGRALVSGAVSGSINDALSEFNAPSSGEPYAASLMATVTLDAAEDISFYLYAAGHARLYVDGVKVGDVTAADLPGAGPGPCPANGGPVCLCQADNTTAVEMIRTAIGAGTREIRIEFLNLDPNGSLEAQWAVGEIGRRTLDLTVPEAFVNQDLDGGGEWGDLEDWPLIAIHTAVLDDGRVLTFGGDENGLANGRLKIDVWDPATGTHVTYDNLTETDLFCAAMVAIPGTSKILIAGGDALPPGGITTAKPDRGGSEYTTWQGITDVNIFDADTGVLEAPADGAMEFPRWYPTILTLATGQLMIFGGTGPGYGGVAVPEIYTYGEGWSALYGAEDVNMAQGWNYPRTFATDDGKVIYFHMARTSVSDGEPSARVMLLDPSGEGSLAQVGELPFGVNSAQPSTLLSDDKALIMSGRQLWVMDFTDAEAPTFEMVADIGAPRNWSNMTLLADGTVLINGGSSLGNTEAGGNKTAVIFDPSDNSVTATEDEMSFRLYHSTATLLRDGTLLTSGGGAAGFAENSYLDSQVYRPAYLYTDDGQPADRPQILDAPLNANTGQTVRITMDDATDIGRITLLKTGASTHAAQMSGGFLEVAYSVVSKTEIELRLPSIDEGMRPGNWMMFAWDSAGAPSIAPIVRVNPEMDLTALEDANLLINGDFEFGHAGEGGDPLGWEVSGNSGLSKNRDFATDGVASLALGANGKAQDGVASQVVATEAGRTYRLEFDAAATAVSGLLVEARDGSAVISSAEVELGKPTTVTFEFVATGPQTALRFSDATGTRSFDYELHLDRMRLREITEYVVNGSFEDGRAGPGVAPTGWSISGTGGQFFSEARATDGQGLYAMDGWGNGQDGVLSQAIFGTVPGEELELSFTAAGSTGTRLRVEILTDNGLDLSEVLEPSGERTVLKFTPSDSDFTLRFSDASAPRDVNYDIDIDAVSLVRANEDLIANGSFERGDARPDGWSIAGNSARVMSQNSALDGEASMTFGAFGANSDGILTQTIATLPEETYELSFRLGGGADDALLVEALNGVIPDLSQVVSLGDADQVTLRFKASGTNTTIRFSDASPGASDISLDQATLSLMPGAKNLVVNGSFSEGGVGPGVAPTGWEISGTGGRHESAARATDGNGYYAIDGWGRGQDGGISQVIDTEIGETYTVTFSVGNRFAPHDLSIGVEAYGASGVAMAREVSVSPGLNTYQMVFIARDAATTLRFADATPPTPNNYDLDLDAVSVGHGDNRAGKNLLINGSFADGAIGPGVAPEGWDISGAGGRHESAVRAADGVGYYAIDGWSTAQSGTISQTVDTVAGQYYTLRFEAGKFGAMGVLPRLEVEALNGAKADLSEALDIEGSDDAFSFTFKASGSQTTIRFADATDDTALGYDIDLDAVSLSSGIRNLVENGSFDEGAVGPGQAPTGWTIDGDGGKHIDADRAGDGSAYYAIGGWGRTQDGTISQEIDTAVGQAYTLAFKASAFARGSADTQLSAEAFGGSRTDLASTVVVN
ncbi:MAG: DUF642 domain-containing protein, partial [Pseudomonadota bacterium]